MQILSTSTPDARHPCYTANGVVGLRFDAAPLGAGWCTLSGYVNKNLDDLGEQYVNTPWPLAYEVIVNGQQLRAEHAVHGSLLHRYCLETGEFTASCRFELEGARGEVQQTVFASRSRPFFVAQEITVRGSSGIKTLVLRAGCDARNAPGRLLSSRNSSLGEMDVSHGNLLWEAPSGGDRLGMAYRLEGSAPVRTGTVGDARLPMGELSVEGAAVEGLQLRQITALVPTSVHREPSAHAVRLMQRAWADGFEGLRAANREAWAEIWKGRILAVGAGEDWQGFIDAQYHYLHCALHPCSPGSTTLFGLGHWPGYPCFHGRVFWDVDTFFIPALSLLCPEAARAHFEFRFRHLPAAQRNAISHGYRGAQFPWETNPGSGEEGLPGAWARMDFEEHISFSVALAFAQFAKSSADPVFLRERAWPVLKGVADWIVSRVRATSRGYELLRTMGICEGDVLDNNAFTNSVSGLVLREAIAAALLVGEAAPAAWSRVADAMYLPRDPVSGVLLRCDGWDLSKSSDATETLAAFFPYWVRDSREKETMRHYLDNGIGAGAIGWPMLPPLFPALAARVGDRACLSVMMQRCLRGYEIAPWRHMDEFGSPLADTKPRVGPYLAHTSAVILNLMLGLPGLQVNGSDPAKWPTFPVTLPEGWEELRIPRLHVGGRLWSVSARNGQHAVCTLLPE